MIELAPRHKIGLRLAQPVMIAAGCAGYGDSYHGLVDLSAFGAIVTGPITLRPQRGARQPRLAETKAGFILNTGQHNPGVKRVIQQYRKRWSRLETQVIAHLPADEPGDLLRTAQALAGIQTPQGYPIIAAFELGLPYACLPADVAIWLDALRDGTELPLLVKLPLAAPPDIIEAAVEAGADALVAGLPPWGAAVLPESGQPVAGQLYGPALHSLALRDLWDLAASLDLPLIGAGGIHSLADAQAFLAAGAAAVQLDSLLFIEPKLAGEIALALKEG